jgi:hypothetical protein
MTITIPDRKLINTIDGWNRVGKRAPVTAPSAKKQDLFPFITIAAVLLIALVGMFLINEQFAPIARQHETIVGKGYSVGDIVPTNFASPYDPSGVTNTPAYLMVTTNNDAITINVQKDGLTSQQYIYKNGYYSQNGLWKAFTFTTPPISGTNWISNAATTTITGLPDAKEEFVIVFVCRQYNADGAYYCGPTLPKDTTRKLWTIQNFTINKSICNICAPGQIRCDPTNASFKQNCMLQANGCYNWSRTQQCTVNETCIDGNCMVKCQDTCSALGAKQCAQSLCANSTSTICASVKTCVSTGGCKQWNTTICAQGQSCDGTTFTCVGGTPTCNIPCGVDYICNALCPTSVGCLPDPDCSIDYCANSNGSLDFACPNPGCAKPNLIKLSYDSAPPAASAYSMCCASANQCAELMPANYTSNTARCYAPGEIKIVSGQNYTCSLPGAQSRWSKCGGTNQPLCPAPACTPTTCAAQGKNCGSISNNCGGTLNCGACTAPAICGTNNICTMPADTNPDTNISLCIPSRDMTSGDMGIRFIDPWPSTAQGYPKCCGNNASEYLLNNSLNMTKVSCCGTAWACVGPDSSCTTNNTINQYYNTTDSAFCWNKLWYTCDKDSDVCRFHSTTFVVKPTWECIKIGVTAYKWAGYNSPESMTACVETPDQN